MHLSFPLVLSQHYGLSGADPKKVDTKNIVFDFEILVHLAKTTVIEDLKSQLEGFVQRLISAKEIGNHNTIFIFVIFTYKDCI